MKLYKTTITPTSNFATLLKGDTLFGQSCWAIRYLFGEERLKTLLSDYSTAPFLIVSDGFSSGYLPKPKLPSSLLGENGDKKNNRKKVWLTPEDLHQGHFCNAKTDREVGEDQTFTVMHNSLNYTTFTTMEGFDPYGVNEYSLTPKDVYCLIDTHKLSLDEANRIFDFLGSNGYGKDTTIGKGRFELSPFEAVEVSPFSKTVMTLSPFSPYNLTCNTLYYEPFTRFGKKGGERSNQNPFKSPLLLADTAAVVCFEMSHTSLYVGEAIQGHTTHSDIVHQGYAIALPIKGLI